MPKSVVRKSLEGFQPYTPGEQPADGEGWVKLNTNESPLPPSPRVIEAIKEAANDSLRLYPSPTAAPARKAIARRFGLDPAQVTIGNGGDELIDLCFRAFVDAGDRVAFPTPTYPLFEPLCRIHEATPSLHPTELPWELPPSLAPDPAPLKLIANPNSPTGALFATQEVEAVVGASPGIVAIDEAYVDFAPHSCLPLLEHHENVLLLRTFSKSYGLAGLRIGFALGPRDLIEAIDSVKDSYNVDRLAIAAAVAAIEDQEHHSKLVSEVVMNRGNLAGALGDLGFDLVPSSANFVFAKPPKPAADVVAALRERRILVRHYDREPIAGWIRITVGTRDQHERLLAALKEIL
ncbi:MAG: histidinol-phosphate transaminase [Chloroflexi bacterium]|nr:MAG: histidinol-phosphate transaminase [Chloroflexota bacterium]TME02888.1 MAG: histidinol-phosphate transaminase [Chloroflexota bacterium]TME43049.1 MAG: histidinol-phosphate transaminase [Chloroflexota bacterium]